MVTVQDITSRIHMFIPFGLYARLQAEGMLNEPRDIALIENQRELAQRLLNGREIKLPGLGVHNENLKRLHAAELAALDKDLMPWCGVRSYDLTSESLSYGLQWGDTHRLYTYSREKALLDGEDPALHGGPLKRKPDKIMMDATEVFAEQRIYDMGLHGWLMTNQRFVSRYKALLEQEPERYWRLIANPEPSIYTLGVSDVDSDGSEQVNKADAQSSMPFEDFAICDETGMPSHNPPQSVLDKARQLDQQQIQERIRAVSERAIKAASSTGKDARFLNEWGQSRMNAPGVFAVIPPIMQMRPFADNPGQVVINHAASGDLVNTEGLSPGLRKQVEKQAREDARTRQPNLAEWYELTGEGNTKRTEEARAYARIYLLQHFARLLVGRHGAEAFHRRREIMRKVIGGYVADQWSFLGKMRPDVIEGLYSRIHKSLGKEWETDLAGHGLA